MIRSANRSEGGIFLLRVFLVLVLLGLTIFRFYSESERATKNVPPNTQQQRIPPPTSEQPAKRPLVKAWQMADLEPLLDQVGKSRNLERGK